MEGATSRESAQPRCHIMARKYDGSVKPAKQWHVEAMSYEATGKSYEAT